ncbi:hypothetical protein [Salmonirosea aquatica]|uniref:Uncharacterized protein n=1 Tax=Salmonirosea aquatica TaxID=2654236 RepID=A0A7C9FMM8_9BACT|nr:hypothetical protein [Cytophagaceae bacterium SJW1-29]
MQMCSQWADNFKEGKQRLNFSELSRLPIAIQNHKFEGIPYVESIKSLPVRFLLPEPSDRQAFYALDG